MKGPKFNVASYNDKFPEKFLLLHTYCSISGVKTRYNINLRKY